MNQGFIYKEIKWHLKQVIKRTLGLAQERTLGSSVKPKNDLLIKIGPYNYGGLITGSKLIIQHKIDLHTYS